MDTLDVSARSEHFQFGAAVRSRSWDWLLALRKRLKVDLQLVDDAHEAVFTAAEGPATGALGGGAPGVRQAISTAIRTRIPQAASVDRLQTVIVPVTIDRVPSGALVVARRTSEDQPLERVRSELELVGFWLVSAIEAHLQSPADTQGDLDRLSALSRLLEDAAIHGSDRDVVAAFVETLAVWHDLEGYGYVETAHEGYARDVALPGADPARTPAVIAHAALPKLDEVSRLAKPDMDRLGFSGGEDVVLARVGENAGSWLVIIAGPIQAEELPRLGLYVSLLDQAVARATQSAIAHILAALSRHLLVDSGNPKDQAGQALRHVQTALGMTSAAFTVTSRTGTPLLHVGSSFTAADLTAGRDAGKVVIVRRDPQQYAMALVGGWSSDHRVTPQESHVAEAAADLLEAWVQRLVRQSHRAGDRRAAQRGFDEVLERVARDAVQDGIPVTAVVISFGDSGFQSDVTQARVVRLRENLRGGDLVGRLSEGDVGVLLQDTSAPQAGALIARVRWLLEREGVPLSQMVIGTATRLPGDAASGPLAQEARQSGISGQ